MREIVFIYNDQFRLPRWVKQFFPPDCSRSVYDPERTYNPDSVVFYYDLYGPGQDTIITNLKRGFQIIYDAKNEHYMHEDKKWILESFKQYPGQAMFLISGHEPQTIPGVTIHATPYWYWIIDQLEYRGFGYDTFVPAPTNQYKFFMQMRNIRPDRDALYEKLSPVLHDSLHSYLNRGVFLPNDCQSLDNWQRYMNFDWINQTCFSLTVETYMNDHLGNVGFSLTKNDSWFLCEKAYKAIASHHPFLFASTHTNLAYLCSMGFETFPELWDESYDNEPDFDRRIELIVDIIKKVDKTSFNQNIVKEKLQHNRARFFDRKLTEKFCNETIIEPVLRFAE